ncbi:MAG: NUDIX domain-containing protein [Saprospiraceae bacterium]|nr:NUDIX domain-containing protein [Saprospiraceae bacterium]MDW8229511.1 NUDIX domain-containing protein [Saprospiraceae bacterium]
MLIFAVRLLVEQEGKLLFLRQTKKNGGRFSLIGGNVEEREFAREALAREALEEAGIHVRPETMQLVHVLHRHKLKKNETLLVLYFRTKHFHGEPTSLEPKKFKDVRWFPIQLLPNEVSKATRHVLEAVQRGEVYSEYPSRSKVLAHWEEEGENWEGFAVP